MALEIGAKKLRQQQSNQKNLILNTFSSAKIISAGVQEGTTKALEKNLNQFWKRQTFQLKKELILKLWLRLLKCLLADVKLLKMKWV